MIYNTKYRPIHLRIKNNVMHLKTFFFFVFFAKVVLAASQSTNSDSLRIKQLVVLLQLAERYTETNPDSSLHYAAQSQLLAVKLNLPLEEVYALGKMGYALINKGDYARALKILLSAVSIAQNAELEKSVLPPSYPSPDEFINRNATARFQRLDNLSHLYQYLGILYANGNNFEKALQYTRMALQLTDETRNTKLACITNITLGRFFLTIHKPDSALLAAQKSYDQAIQADYPRYLGSIYLNIGRIHLAKGNHALAALFFHKAKEASIKHDYQRGAVASGLQLANYYSTFGKKDSALVEINEALSMAQHMGAPDLLLRCYNAKAQYYKSEHNSDSVVYYQDLSIHINDGIFNAKQLQQFQNIDFDEQQRVSELEKEKEKIENRNRAYLLLTALGAMFLIALLLYHNNRQKLKANSKLELTLNDLKATQAQLIQSEKMASLGELTAGIAHEIQNPLNFVNNFSEINKEMLFEMKEELAIGNKHLATGNSPDAKIKIDQAIAIANDVIDNSEKINHHGKRAENIVKGMLQHSRTSTGVKEHSDINVLAEEYMRLSYQGLRAKDKTFIANYKMVLDPDLPMMNVIPQDLGRVFLNLFNNAFWAVGEKSRLDGSSPNGSLREKALPSSIPDDYQPTVTLTTKHVLDHIEIRVHDNGSGISDTIKDKIFQPFFTTKPTGQGTGLGLSLAYDIVKAHQGEITVDSTAENGTEFTIILPII